MCTQKKKKDWAHAFLTQCWVEDNQAFFIVHVIVTIDTKHNLKLQIMCMAQLICHHLDSKLLLSLTIIWFKLLLHSTF